MTDNEPGDKTITKCLRKACLSNSSITLKLNAYKYFISNVFLEEHSYIKKPS